MEFFGISGPEFIVLVIIALLVVGPETVVQALQGLKKLIASVRSFSERLREETAGSGINMPGLDLSDIDLNGLDPRQMIREAVQEEMQEWMKQANSLNPEQMLKNPPKKTN